MAKRRGGSGLEKARAKLRAKYGTDNIGEINKMKKRGSAGRRKNPTKTKRAATPQTTVARVAKKRSRKKNASPSAPKPEVKTNPVETTTMEANPRRRRRRRKSKARRRGPRRTKSGRFMKRRGGRRHARRRRRNPLNERRVGAKSRNTHVGSVKGYTRKSTVRRHRRRVNPVTAIVKNPIMANRRRRRHRRRNPASGLMSNAGPYTTGALKHYGVAVVGAGLGLVVSSALDRYVATRKPKGGSQPYFGRAAAGAIALRPDAVRLGAQAGLAVVGMGAAYLARRVKVLPWLLGGISFGAGANLTRMLVESYLMPMVLVSKDGSDKGLGNRLYPLEQKYVQDSAKAFMDNWQGSVFLASQQVAGAVPVAPGGAPLATFVLGESPEANGVRFVGDGTLGRCQKCNGQGGHFTNCPDYCPSCGMVGDHTVKPGDNLVQYAMLSGVDPNYVAGLNGGRALNTFKPGEEVTVPFKLGRYIEELEEKTSNGNGKTAAETSAPIAPVFNEWPVDPAE